VPFYTSTKELEWACGGTACRSDDLVSLEHGDCPDYCKVSKEEAHCIAAEKHECRRAHYCTCQTPSHPTIPSHSASHSRRGNILGRPHRSTTNRQAAGAATRQMQHRELRKDHSPVPSPNGRAKAWLKAVMGCDGERLGHEWRVEGRNVANPDAPTLGDSTNSD
jgi:hypothetical protein